MCVEAGMLALRRRDDGQYEALSKHRPSSAKKKGWRAGVTIILVPSACVGEYYSSSYHTTQNNTTFHRGNTTSAAKALLFVFCIPLLLFFFPFWLLLLLLLSSRSDLVVVRRKRKNWNFIFISIFINKKGTPRRKKKERKGRDP